MWGMMEIYDKDGPYKTKNEARNSLGITILLEERQLGNMQRDFNNMFIHDLTTSEYSNDFQQQVQT